MIYCPKALEENCLIRQRMFIRRWHFEISIFLSLFSMRSSRNRSRFRWHRPYLRDWLLSAWAARWFQLLSLAAPSFPSPGPPFRKGFFFFFWCTRNWRNSAACQRGGRWTHWNPGAVVPRGLILLWRGTRWWREIYIDFDWILCFAISKGHNYFHCEVFMIQQNCFLAKRYLLLTHVWLCYLVFISLFFLVFCITPVSIVCIFLTLLYFKLFMLMMIPFQWNGSKTSTLSCKTAVLKLNARRCRPTSCGQSSLAFDTERAAQREWRAHAHVGRCWGIDVALPQFGRCFGIVSQGRA